MIDPRKLRPSELCRLLNSTPMGEVINESQLRRHRTRAGLRIGDGRRVDLVRYVAWLVQDRHSTRSESPSATVADLTEAAQGAATLGTRWNQMGGHGQKLGTKQEALIAALLTEANHVTAATKAGVGKTTLYRWMHVPEFRAAYRRARRELVEAAIGRLQAATGEAVEILLDVARHGRRDGDRVRAAMAVIDRALGGLADVDILNGERRAGEAASMSPSDVVQMLAARLRQLEASELPVAEKSKGRRKMVTVRPVLDTIYFDLPAKKPGQTTKAETGPERKTQTRKGEQRDFRTRADESTMAPSVAGKGCGNRRASNG